MLPHIDAQIPVVVVANFVEAHYVFLSRGAAAAESPSPLTLEAYHEDRTLLWVGDPKLVIASHDIPHAQILCQQLGYAGTRHIAPMAPTPFLSVDILREQELLNQLIAYAGESRTVQIVPYAATSQFMALVKALRETHRLEVLLPECPAPEALWLRDAIDSKSGFYYLAGRWLPDAGDRLPEGYVCRSVEHAAAVASWFHAEDRTCIAKPDTGESGLGAQILEPAADFDAAQLAQTLGQNPYWGDEPILVEEYLTAVSLDQEPVSPSVELYVPHHDDGEPYVTYVSEQLFHVFGEFCGVLVSRDQQAQPWYEACVSSSLLMARELQLRGYAGHFDVDAIVDDGGRPVLLEINARRTGGTHVHDFAYNAIGPDYLDKVALLSWEGIDCGPIGDWQSLFAILDKLLYPIDGDRRGILVTVASSVVENQFGVLIVGNDRQDVLRLQYRMTEIIQEIYTK